MGLVEIGVTSLEDRFRRDPRENLPRLKKHLVVALSEGLDLFLSPDLLGAAVLREAGRTEDSQPQAQGGRRRGAPLGPAGERRQAAAEGRAVL